MNNGGRTGHRHLRLLRSERSGTGRGRREHAVAVRAGHVDRSAIALTLNLGVRTEKRNDSLVPYRHQGRPRSSSASGKKIAPRLGASFDLIGAGRLKPFGSWGRYYDWVKYSLARGSFGGDTWLIYYRSLDTLDVNSLNVNNMPGRDLWGGFRDRRAPTFRHDRSRTRSRCSRTPPTPVLEYQRTPTTVFGVNYVHNKLTRTIEDVGSWMHRQ